jgi:hypothetical protein
VRNVIQRTDLRAAGRQVARGARTQKRRSPDRRGTLACRVT